VEIKQEIQQALDSNPLLEIEDEFSEAKDSLKEDRYQADTDFSDNSIVNVEKDHFHC